MSNSETLSWLVERGQRNFATDASAHAYLRSNGIHDEKVWQQYRLGVGDTGLLDAVDDPTRQCLDDMGLIPKKGPKDKTLCGNGIFLPTFNPASPQAPVGLVKMTWAQNKHGFITAPIGIACAPDINEHPRTIITDTPFLALRLADMGLKGVAVAEVPGVLTGLRDWLAEREVVISSYRSDELEALRRALPQDIVGKAKLARVHGEIECTNSQTMELLGLPPFVPQRITPHLIARVVEFARARMMDGHGAELLRQLGVSDPEFAEAYQLGFLPDDFFTALPAEAKSILRRRLSGPSIIAPAFDESGIPVDLLIYKGSKQKWPEHNLNDEPKGLLAPRVASSNSGLLVCDTLKAAADVWKQGTRNVSILRGALDAANNATRLLDAGVRSIKIVAWIGNDDGEAAAVLTAARIVVEAAASEPVVVCDPGPALPPPPTITVPANHPAVVSVETDAATIPSSAAQADATVVPATPPIEARESESGINLYDFPDKPMLLSHDERMMRARFKAGKAIYEVETALDCNSKLEVTVEYDGQKHRDRFDLSRAAQRKRFSESTALKVKVPFEIVETHLLNLLDSVRDIQREVLEPKLKKSEPTAAMSDAEKAEALALLRNPNLLDIVSSDLEALGIVGERRNALLLYMVSTSRLLPFKPPLAPLSAALISPSSAGKTFIVETVLSAIPPDASLHVSKLSDNAMFYLDRNALSHRILVVPESDILTKDISVTLRILLSNGALTHSHVQRDSMTGSARSQIAEAKGPVSLMTTTTGGLDDQVLSRCVEIRLDESAEQSNRIAQNQLRFRSDGAFANRREAIINKHHRLQRMLETRAVLIPFAARIEFDASRVQHRRLLDKLLNLTAAVALLMQHQRPKDGEVIIASERDFTVAADLLADVIGCASDDLSANARDVLALVQSAGVGSFSMDDLKALRPDWTRYRFRAGLDELLRLEVFTSPVRGRGKVRQYQLQNRTASALKSPIVRLRKDGVGELAKVGEMGLANFTPKTATG